MRETAITLLTCVMVLLSAPVALAAPPTAVEASGGASSSEGTPSSSPTPGEPPGGSFPSELPLPSRPPAESTPTPEPTSTPTPTPEPSGVDSGPDDEDGSGPDHEDVHTGLQSVHRRSAEPPAVSRSSSPGLTDRTAGTAGPHGGRHYGDYDYSDYDYGDDDHGSVADTPYSDSRAAPPTGQLLPVLPLGTGLALLGLGLISFALRLRH